MIKIYIMPNMYSHVVPMSDEEKKAMYMELPKEQLVSMLMENQRLLQTYLGLKYSKYTDTPIPNNECQHREIKTDGGGDYCRDCGKRW